MLDSKCRLSSTVECLIAPTYCTPVIVDLALNRGLREGALTASMRHLVDIETDAAILGVEMQSEAYPFANPVTRRGADAEVVLPATDATLSPQTGLHHPTFIIAHHDNRCAYLLFAAPLVEYHRVIA